MPRPSSGSDRRTGGRFSVMFPTTVDALPAARIEFSEWLDGAGAVPEANSELVTVFSELAANAVDASADSALEAQASAWRDRNDVVLEVANAHGSRPLGTDRWDGTDQLRSGGRGLMIVQAYADHVEIDQDDEGRLVVRCRRSLAEAR